MSSSTNPEMAAGSDASPAEAPRNCSEAGAQEGERPSKPEFDPLDPAIMSKQATINIGTIGHVAHGKTTLVEAISGVKTAKFKKEKERNITMELGYANAKIYRGIGVPRPECYTARGSKHPDKFEEDGVTYVLERHVSFVDCPGHEVFMRKMLSGASVMDSALLLVAANEPAPQPQCKEHLAAIRLLGLEDKVTIVQNKVDLVTRQKAAAQVEDIRAFLQNGSKSCKMPLILPISAIKKVNIDLLLDIICNQKVMPVPRRDFKSPPVLSIIRSFNVNHGKTQWNEMVGGVIGGTLVQGILRVGQEVEIRPGLISKDKKGKFQCRPLVTRVMSMKAEKNKLKFAVPGGLIGVGTLLDPWLAEKSRLAGQVLGVAGHLPPIYEALQIEYKLMTEVVGAENATRVSKLVKDEQLSVNYGSTQVLANVTSLARKGSRYKAVLKLEVPVCSADGNRIALSRKVGDNWRLIGWGEVIGGKEPKICKEMTGPA